MNLFLWLCSVILGVSFCFLLSLRDLPPFFSPHFFIACLSSFPLDFRSSVFVLSPSLVLQGVDVSADLQRRPQFDVHAGHQVVLGQQQQSLAVDLLQPERLRHVTAAWNTSTRRRLKKRNVTACLNSYCKTTYCPFKDELWSETTALAVGQRASNKQHEQI